LIVKTPHTNTHKTQIQYQEARRILTTHKKELDRLANALLQYETLNKEEILTIIQGGKLSRPV